MANEYKEQILKIQKLEPMYVAFSQGTKHPFVICDEESYNDQIWTFENEEQAKEFVKQKFEETKDMLIYVKVPNNQLLLFFSNQYLLGVNEVVFVEKTRQTKIPLEQIVVKPDYSKLPPQKRPLLNPQMQLTGIYFMQELYKRKPNNEKPQLRELEEEMAANLVRSRFLIASEKIDKNGPADAKNLRIPYVKNKEDKTFLPLFTDPQEFSRFNTEKKFHAGVLEFTNVEKVVGANAEGIVVNPYSLNIVILKEKLPSLLKRFAKA